MGRASTLPACGGSPDPPFDKRYDTVSMLTTKVLLADDHAVVAQGLESLLKKSFDLVGVVHDGHALVDAAEKLRPDVIVTDISMPGLNGLDAIGQIRARRPGAKIVVLTMHRDTQLAVEAFRAGASGYVLKVSPAEELIRAMAENTGLCRHIHLPVQAGSDRILSLMNRKYTVARYLSLVSMIRRILPDADITTDLMVGFPSETEEEFAATLALVGEVRFTTAFMCAYSAREGTAAAKLKDDLPRDIKIERLNRLIALQTSITRDLYEGLVGQTAEIMVYGPLEKRGESFLRGQDRGCKRVLVRGLRAPPGTVLTAQIVRSSGMTLIAERE